MKRFLSFVLAVLMVFSMSVSIVATDTETPAITPDTVGADGINEDTVITLYDEPVVTTVGTKANLLAPIEGGKYIAKTDGARGFAFIFKVEGSEPGTIIGKFDMNVTARKITAVDAETGEKTYSDPETKGPIWNGNWVADVYNTNSYVLDGDGYYIYWFPFRSIENSWTNVETIAGETTLNGAYIFNQTGALGNNRAGKIVPDADIKVSCLGIIEGSIDTYDVIAYNKQTDAYEAKASGVSVNALSGGNAAQWSKVSTPDELFGKFYGAGENEYVSSWTDRDGNAIDGSLESLLGTKVVKPVYTSYTEEEIIKLTFVDAEGKSLGDVGYLNAGLLVEGEIPAAPAKAGDGVLKYVFKGWSIDGQTVIDVLGTEYEGDTTIKPVFAEYGTHYDADPITLPVVSSEVSETVDESKTTTDANGNTIEYVTKTITVTTTYPDAEPVTKETSIVYKRTTKADGSSVTTAYESNSAKNELTALNVLPGQVTVDSLANGVTFVYKIDGIETEAIVDNLSVAIKSKNNAGSWQWDDAKYSNDGLAPSQLTLDKNGYFYIYFNDNINGLNGVSGDANTVFTKFDLFHGAVNQSISSEDGSLRGPVNANENATFQMLAAVSDNLQPTVTYLNEDGTVYQTVTHKYTDITGNLGYGNGYNMPRSCQNGELLSADEIFAAAGLDLPTKASDNPEIIYEFKGWVDAEGNAVDNIYTNTTVKATFVEKDTRTQYTVKFVNDDGTVLQEGIVLEGDTPEYKGETPAKASTSTAAYKFIGWDKEITATPANDANDGALATEAIVYTATYEEITAAEITTQAGTYFEGENALDPVVLGTTEQKVWEGDVDFSDPEGNSGITLVYRIEGAKSPIDPGDWDMEYYYNADGGVNKFSSGHWFWNNKWKGKVLKEIIQLDKDGIYYTYINCRMTPNSGNKYFGVKSFSILKSGSTIVNENENATFQMLAIIEDNLMPTVNFYGADGEFLGSATHQYTFGNKSIGEDGTKASAHGMVLTSFEMAAEAGIALPTKEATAEYRYQLTWVDADGNEVDGVYKSQDLYAKFIAIDNTISTVTFVDADGNVVTSDNQKKGGAPTYEGATPVKAEDDDNIYVFAGWSLDGENVVDLAAFTLSDDEYTFKPVYVADRKVKAVISAPDTIEMGAEVEISFIYNRDNVSSDVLKDEVATITAGEITVAYDKTIFNVAGNEGDNTGSATVAYGETLKLVALDGRAGYSKITVTGGKVSADDVVVDVPVYSTEKLIGVVGQQPGAYFDLDPVVINKNDGENKPAGQNLWSGKVNVLDGNGNAVDGVTFVYKLDGIETEIIADNFNVVLNGDVHGWNSSNWQNGGNNGGMVTAEQKFSADGYYFMYLNQIPNGANTYKTVDSFRIFQHADYKGGPNRTNANENATFQMLAIVSNNLAPTVNFYNGDELITSYTHAYTEYTGKLWNSNAKTVGNLLTAEEVYALTELAAPEKKADSNGVYTFKGWVDAEGNPVDGVYANMDVYADYDVKEAIVFADENGDAIGVFEIVDGGLAEDAVIPAAPAKAGDGIITYAFAGWTVDGETVVDPATYEYTGSVVFKPLYNQYGAYLDGEAVALPKVSTEVSETSETVDNDDGSSVTTTVTTYVTTATYADGTTVTSTRVVTTKVTTGADGKTKTEVSGTDENKIALNILTEEVATDPLSTGITLVYKVEGADTEIIADNAWMTTTKGGPSWHWKFANKITLNNGYYYLHLNDGVNGLNTVKDPAKSILTSFSLFRGFDKNCASDGRPATNANENASIQILAVTDNNIAPTAVFHDADGNVLAEYTNTYFTKLGASAFHAGAVKTGALLSIAEVQTLAAVETPVKAPTHDGRVTYEFAGWVDADGNAVDAFYYNVDLYPSFKIASDARPEYTVKFVDEDGTELYSVKVREEDIPEYVGEEPAKAADKKNTYEFAGWDAEIVAATADVTYKATYTATAIEYIVTFMNGDVEIGRAGVLYEGKVTPPAAPAKEATAQYTYTFDKWVDAEGNAVDLNKITDNITVYTKYTETVNKYTVTFVNDDGTEIEKVTVNYGTAATAPEAKKDATDEYTYTFDKWVDAEGNEADFSKVVADITVKATYTATKNEVTVTFMDGETEIEKVTVTYGTEAKATADPTKETANFTKYTFAGWVDAEGNKVDLTKVEADVTVYASYTTECEHSFDDIKDGEWYVEAVEWALMNGVMNGEGAKFNPNKATSRAMIVTVLYRIEGSPDVSAVEHPFTDIEEGQWYYDAVLWAYSEGVVNGMSATTYAPDATLTREQFATILYRYAKEIKGEDVSVDEGANLDAYTDKDEVSGYALDAVLWTNVNGYIGGTSATKLSPKGSATRAQMATILYRYITAE